MDFDKETALVEAVFYLEGEPLNTDTIARITDLSKEVVAEVLTRLKERYAANDSGIELEQISAG